MAKSEKNSNVDAERVNAIIRASLSNREIQMTPHEYHLCILYKRFNSTAWSYVKGDITLEQAKAEGDAAYKDFLKVEAPRKAVEGF